MQDTIMLNKNSTIKKADVNVGIFQKQIWEFAYLFVCAWLHIFVYIYIPNAHICWQTGIQFRVAVVYVSLAVLFVTHSP